MRVHFKITKFAIFLVIIDQVCCDFIAKAIIEVITNFYSIHDGKIDVLCFACENLETIRLLEEITHTNQQNGSIPFRVVKAEINWHCQLSFSSIILFDSFDIYNTFLQKVKWKKILSSTKPNHLLYVRELTKGKFIKLFEGNYLSVNHFVDYNFIPWTNRTYLEHNFLNVNYLIDINSTSLELITLEFFSKKYCQISQPTTINQFSKVARKWHSSNFFPRKASNMHNCRLTFVYLEGLSVFYTRKDKLSKKEYLTGFAYEVHNAIANKLNIQAHYISSDILDDEKIRPSLEIVCSLQVTNLLVHQSDQVGRKAPITQLESFVFEGASGFYIPPGHPYTQFEKLFLMFDENVWIAIAITFIGGFMILQVLNAFCSKVIQDFVFGFNIRTTNMNYIGTIVGNSQPVLPKTNFARFILMMFIMLCLVLRTCHQSQLYSLMQSDKRHVELRTIDEAIQKNYTFYMMHSEMNNMLKADFMQR